MSRRFPEKPAQTKAKTLAHLTACSERVFTLLSKRTGHALSVRIILAPNATMDLLARRYLKKEKPLVDVLSFPEPRSFPQPDAPTRVLGDIYLNWDAFKHDQAHLRFLLVHGILHLRGYEHETKHGIVRMETLERRLCETLASPDSTSAPRL